MKKSSLYLLALLLIPSLPVHADSRDHNAPQYQSGVTYSEEFLRRTKEKIQNDPNYATSYFEVAYKVLRAEKATDQALVDVKLKVQDVESKMRSAINAAPKLPDGTVFFKSKDRAEKYFTLEGREVPPSEITTSASENTVVWENYLDLYNHREALFRDREKLIKYRDETLKSSRIKLPDPDLLNLSEALAQKWLDYKHQHANPN